MAERSREVECHGRAECGVAVTSSRDDGALLKGTAG